MKSLNIGQISLRLWHMKAYLQK
ncbi:MAG: hypothetical protein QOJ42_3520, partial [Acidobacteriaceae bacterium]|nr:hypothetical protein [Acidobacteriaceae bacterium]